MDLVLRMRLAAYNIAFMLTLTYTFLAQEAVASKAAIAPTIHLTLQLQVRKAKV